MPKVIRLDGEIGWEINAKWLAEKIEGETDVDLIINSPGGSITEGFAIFNLLKDFEGTLTARIDLAASMASVIAMAADKIVMRSDSSLMMIHKPWTGAMGEAEDLRSIADTLDKMEEMILNIYSSRAKVETIELKEMLARETWLSGSEALEVGLADEVAEDKAQNMLTKTLTAMAAKHVSFDITKMAAKIETINKKSSLTERLNNCQSLSEVELLIKSMGASKNEASVIVAKVKSFSLGEQDESIKAEMQNVFNKFTFIEG